MQKAEQTLNPNDPGVARHKFVRAVNKFLDESHHGDRVSRSVEKDNRSVLGFKGEGSKFWTEVLPFGQGDFDERPKGETDIYLIFWSDSDVKMRVEWSASITDPLDKPLQTSVVLSTVFEKKDGEFINNGFVDSTDSKMYDVRILEDAKFGLRKDITERGWLIDGALHVTVDVRFKVLEGEYPKTATAVDLFLSAFRHQLDNPIFPDFTLISADGEEIKIHKVILAIQSPVFRTMFENSLEETRTGICKIEDADAKSIKAMLAFLVGVEPEKGSFELAGHLFALADKYQLMELRKRSAVELAKTLSKNNLVEVLLLAYRHSEKALLNEAFLFLEDNFMEATLDGLMVRLASKEVPEALVRQWRAHWFMRQRGIEIEEIDLEGTADPQ